MTQADFQTVLASLKQAVADVGTRVTTRLAELESEIERNQPVDLAAEAVSINEDIASLAQIAPTPVPPPLPEPAPLPQLDPAE